MADMNRLAERMIDVSERFADAVDGAQGRGQRKSSGSAKWLILPAAGAAAYGLVTSSSSLARQTRGLMRRAKDRATDLPDADLFGRVKEVTGSGSQQRRTSTTSRSQAQNRRRRTNQRRSQRKTTTSR